MDPSRAIPSFSQAAPAVPNHAGPDNQQRDTGQPSASAGHAADRPLLIPGFDGIQQLHARARHAPPRMRDPEVVVDDASVQSANAAVVETAPEVAPQAPAANAPGAGSVQDGAPATSSLAIEFPDLATQLVTRLEAVQLLWAAKAQFDDNDVEAARQLISSSNGRQATPDGLKKQWFDLFAASTFRAQAAAIRLAQASQSEVPVSYERIHGLFDEFIRLTPTTQYGNVETATLQALAASASQPLFADSVLCLPERPNGKSNQMDATFQAAIETLKTLRAGIEADRAERDNHPADLEMATGEDPVERRKSEIDDIKLALGPLKLMAAAYRTSCEDRVKELSKESENGDSPGLEQAKQELESAKTTYHRLHVEEAATHLLECRSWATLLVAICHEAILQGLISATHLGAVRTATEQAITGRDGYDRVSADMLVRTLGTGTATGAAHYMVSEFFRPPLAAFLQYCGARRPDPIAAEALYPDAPRVRYRGGELWKLSNSKKKRLQDAIKLQRLSLNRLQTEAKLGTATGDWTGFASFAVSHAARAALGFTSIGARSLASGLGGMAMASGHTLRAMLQTTTRIPRNLQVLRPDVRELPTYRLGKQSRLDHKTVWETNRQAVKDGAKKAALVNPADNRVFDPGMARTLVTRITAANSGILVTACLDMLSDNSRPPAWLSDAMRGAGNAVGLLWPFYAGITADTETAAAVAASQRTGIQESDPFKGTRTAANALLHPHQDHVINLSERHDSKVRPRISAAHNVLRHVAIVPQQALIEGLASAGRKASAMVGSSANQRRTPDARPEESAEQQAEGRDPPSSLPTQGT